MPFQEMPEFAHVTNSVEEKLQGNSGTPFVVGRRVIKTHKTGSDPVIAQNLDAPQFSGDPQLGFVFASVGTGGIVLGRWIQPGNILVQKGVMGTLLGLVIEVSEREARIEGGG